MSEWELWAAANHVIEIHGDQARVKAVERQQELEAAGDTGGVNAWTAIHCAYRSASGGPQHSEVGRANDGSSPA